jgi:iron complex outermembrane receptor protein
MFNHGKRHIGMSAASVIAIIAAFATQPALAQAAPKDEAAADQISDIVVTASKRGNQTLQTVPSSIGVLTSEALAKRDVGDFVDITRNVAGLNVVNEGPGQNTILIRGLVGAGEPTVGLYYDNLVSIGSGESAATSAGRQTDLLVFDAERIEVLRGPQSTLYGSSALAGVVRVISREADPRGVAGKVELEGSTISHGSQNYSLKGMVNLPVSDNAAIRLVGYHVHDGGFIDNVKLGIRDINSSDQTGFRLNTKILLGDRTTLTSQLYVQRLESNGAAYARPYDATVGATAYPAVGPLATDKGARESFNDTTILAGLTLEHQLDHLTLTLTQSYQRRDNVSISDQTPLGSFFRFLQSVGAFPNVPTPRTLAFRAAQKTELWNTEARVATNFDGRFNGVIGALYQTRQSRIDNQFIDADPASGLPIAGNPLWYRRGAEFNFDQLALFGEATVKLTDRVSVLAGARVFKNKRHDISTSIVSFLRLGSPGAPDDVRSNESKVIYKLEADYRPTDDMLLYLSASQGYRAGGTIVRVVPELPPSYGPDYTWNFEGGAKTQWFDHKLQANLALYRVNWYNTQISGDFFNGTFSGVLNCQGLCATSQGIEMDITARPMRGLDLSLSGTVFKAKWVKDQPAINGSPAAGTQFAKTPRFTFNASSAYAWNIGNDLEVELRADLQHSGSVAFTDYRAKFNLHPPKAYSLVNIAATLSSGNRWSTKLFARNLFDERAVLNVVADSTTPYDALIAQPRTVGLQFNFSY